MMDYSKLNDFEINKRVLKIKSGIKPLGYAHNADERSAGIVDVSKNYHWYDFCNDTPGAGLDIGIKYPIIKIDGIYTIVGRDGCYHDEPENSRFLDYCQPYYTIEIVDDKTGEKYPTAENSLYFSNKESALDFIKYKKDEYFEYEYF